MTRTQRTVNFIADRLAEPTTWRGIAFLLALCGAKFGADLDWGEAAALGGIVSACLKMIVADDKP
jgi:hypothetical protein